MAAQPFAIRASDKAMIAVATGKIDSGFTATLEQQLEQNRKVKLLLIESNGGRISEARRVIKLLNRHKVTVRVIGRCASACALIWAGAPDRQLRSGALIGLHAGSLDPKVPRLLQDLATTINNDFSRRTLAHAGFSKNLIARSQSTPNTSVLWLSPMDLQNDGVRFTLLQ